MDAILPRTRFWHRSEGHALAKLQPTIAVLLTALLLVTAVLLASRRLTGALVHPLPPLAMLGVGLFLAGVTLGSRSLLNVRETDLSVSATWLSNAGRWTPTALLPLIAWSISLPGSSIAGLAGLWLTVLGEETWYWTTYLRRAKNVAHPASFPDTATSPQIVEAALADEPVIEADWQSTSLTQRLAYERTESGGLTVEGWLRADFQPDQRTAVLHIAFCPPFAGTPQVEAEPLDGPDCTVRPTLVLPWGVRWEIKLDSPATEPQCVILGFHASEASEPMSCLSQASAAKS
jgi:hypothetical protein